MNPFVAFAMLILVDSAPPVPRLVTTVRTYRARADDTWDRLANRFSTTADELAAMNATSPVPEPVEGQTVRVVSYRVLTTRIPNGIVINVPERALYLFRDESLVTVMPVAVGRGPTRHANWSTKRGDTGDRLAG